MAKAPAKKVADKIGSINYYSSYDDMLQNERIDIVSILTPSGLHAKQTIEIVKKLGRPIISTSIRDEDEIIEYTTDPELIHEKYMDLVDAVIDGGYGDNEASTVIDCSNEEFEILFDDEGNLTIAPNKAVEYIEVKMTISPTGVSFEKTKEVTQETKGKITNFFKPATQETKGKITNYFKPITKEQYLKDIKNEPIKSLIKDIKTYIKNIKH